MKRIFLRAMLALAMGYAVQTANAADTNTTAKTELKALVSKVQAKMSEKKGEVSKEDLAPFFKDFDALIEKYKAEKTDDVAQILWMDAMLYFQVAEDADKATEILKKLKQDFPDTKPAQEVDKMLKGIETQKAAMEIQKKLAVGAAFPDFNEKDLDGKPLSIANYKGKYVLIDFWATWCGPCVGELPNVLKAYEKYHAKGFEIIGISLDNKEEALKDFIKTKGMAWPQYFDGKGWQSKLAGVYGITSIPATYLLDGEGKIIAKGESLRGNGLDEALGKYLK